MKATIPDYLSLLSMNQYDLLEEIFEKYYIESIELYWLIRKYSDQITKIKYEQSNRSLSLKVRLRIRGKKPANVVEEMLEVCPSNCVTKITFDKTEICIVMRKKAIKKPKKRKKRR